jgi:photosystem P840 reaction center large subunit
MSVTVRPGAPVINRPALNKAAELHIRGYNWYQLFAFPRTEDQIFGGHLMVAGAIGMMVAFNIGSGVTNPANYFYLSIEPGLYNLGIDTKEKVLAYALIHIITSIGLIVYGWWHYRNRILQAASLTYAKAWGGHMIYIAWWMIAWNLWSLVVMQRGPVLFGFGLTDAARKQADTLRTGGLGGLFNFDGMLLILALVLIATGIVVWNKPPTFNRHLEDPKAQFHVNLIVFGWTGMLYSAWCWFTYPRGDNAALGQWSDVALNLNVWNHINCSALYIFAGVFHGAQYLWDVRDDDTKNPWVTSKWIRWFDKEDRQVDISAIVFFFAFFTGFSAWGVAGINSMVDFKLFPPEWYVDWLKPYLLEWVAPGLLHVWPGYVTSVSDWVFIHVLVGGLFFVLIPLVRAVFFTRRSPLFDAKGITKRSFDYPCIGPAYGGT